MDIFILCASLILGVFALLTLWLEGVLVKKSALAVSAALIFAAMLLRGLCMGHETLDYQNFLTKWVDFFRNNGGWSALSMSIGNYNVPYLYFLALFSYSGVRDLYLIKFLSVFFDIVLAWAVMRIVRISRRDTPALLCAFFTTLFLPTVILNGAYWGQCDSIYGAFAVMSVLFALERRPALSVISVAVSFAFKLQAVFIMPVFLIFIYTGRMKWRHLLLFPLTYLVMVLPAILAGRPAADTVMLYFNQAGSVGGAVNYNSPSIFAFTPYGADGELLSKLGIAAAFVFLAAVFLWLFLRRKYVSDRALLAVCLLISAGVPFLLPHMHDRYFFIADVLSLALAITIPSLAALPVLMSFASLLGYHAYLKMRYLLPMKYGAAAVAAVLVITALCIASETSPKLKGRSAQ